MKKNDALTPVVSAILALLIVTSTMSSVLLWGVPYIEEVGNTTSKENADRQFISAAEAMDDLVNSNPGNKVVNTLDLGKGSISIDVDEKDRTVIMYSFSDEYDFTVDLPDTCFLAGTNVVMADRAYKPIEDIEAGEFVLSYDEETETILPSKVTAVFHHTPEEMTPYYLIINTQLCVTPNHQFYTNGRWKVADNLQVGDLLFDREQGMAYPIYSLEKVYKREASFDVEVDQYHTYFVSIDERTDVLVHNAGGGGGGGSSPNPETQYSQRDSYMYLLAPNANYGSLNYMRVNYKLSQLRRMVLWFWTYDLGIPEGAYIMSADLNIYYYDETGDPSSRYHECWELDTYFYEDEVCWNRPRDGANNWNGGLDAIRTDVGVIDTIQVGNHGWKTWDVTESVQAFVNGDRYDCGWLIADQTETVGLSKGAKYRSKEWSGTTSDPYLEISYSTDPECQTNEPTNVGQTSLTLNGEVVDDGREAVQYRFYGRRTYSSGSQYTGPFGSWTGSKWTGETFNYAQSGLKRGTYGWYYARVRHSFHTLDMHAGETVYFLLQPAPLTGLTADIINPGLINLSWINGDGGEGAYIEYATGSKPNPWNVGAGIQLNDSGANYGYVTGESYSHTVNPDTTYYYKTWAYAEDGGFISDGTDAFPFGGFMEIDRTTPKIPTVTTHDATDNISTIATLHGALSDLKPTSDYSYCNVGFEYGLSDGYGNYEYVGNLTDNLSFSANIGDLTPGKTYHFRAVGSVDEYPYRFYGNDKTFTTWIDGIFVLSPGDRYKWRRGITQKIEWAYNPLIWDHHVNITWQRDGEEGLINDDLPISMGSYNWSINLTQPLGHLNYTIKITSSNDTGIHDTSGLFSITELHEGIVHNETYDDPEDSLGIIMIEGEIEYANVYWLDYGGELDPPALSGAVCIDLYNIDNYLFGSIWIIDSDSVAYESFSGNGDLQKITMENGGIISYRADGSYVQMSPPIFAVNDVFSIHAVQMIGLSMSAGGMSRFKIKMDADLYMNRIREQEHIYNLRLQFYGDNHEAWVTYFTSNYEFEEEDPAGPSPPNTLFYTPSLSKLWFAFAHSSVELSLHN